ncbi:unnamed protein product [Clonostachys byssicola]|uniref:Amino acid transporter n=1 Tax=Clonostachys byssicola TaxID=160290 RepID=A0A9N9UF96_9HYPO|nr:unnamed protein product [Clonostachys byssicola]
MTGHEQAQEFRPQMKQSFNLWSLAFMACLTSTTWEAVTSTMAQALSSGGSSSMVWGFLTSACGTFSIAMALAEFSSMVPTAGGQYHYVAALSAPKYRRILSWLSGWVTLWGWLLATLAGNFANAMSIQSLIILFLEDYTYQRWHTSLVSLRRLVYMLHDPLMIIQIVIVLSILYTVMSLSPTKLLHYANYVGMLLHCSGYIITITYLLVKTPVKQSAEKVFTDTTNLSGWSPGVAWSIGLMSSALSMVGWDSACHMAEEMKQAPRDIPRTMIGAVGMTGVLTFPWVIALMFCITDIEEVVTGPVGVLSPLNQLIYNTSGGNAAATVGIAMSTLIMNIVASGPSCMAATARIAWSFSLEGGLPEAFGRMNSKAQVPLNATIGSCIVVCLLSLIYIGNSTAFYGLSSGVTVVVYVSYMMPIALYCIWGFKHCPMPRGPFTLGTWSRPINYFALAWCTYLVIFLCFPTTIPTSAETMNYASLILGTCIVLPMGAWFVYGNKVYDGVMDQIVEGIENVVVAEEDGANKAGKVSSISVS